MPTVPAAYGLKPEPKPVAMNTIGSFKVRGGIADMLLTFQCELVL